MKLPQSFIPNKDLEKITKRILKKKEYHPEKTAELLKSCEEFLQEQDKKCVEDTYILGQKIANGLSYTKKNLEEISRKIIIKREEDRYLGFYLSALINKIIKEEHKIILNPRAKLTGLGAYLKEGTLIIKGSTQNYTGAFMSGGVMLVKGNVEELTGYYKEGGAIIIEGEVGNYTAYQMKGGPIIIVKGDVKDPREYYEGDEEFIFNKKVRGIYLPSLTA